MHEKSEEGQEAGEKIEPVPKPIERYPLRPEWWKCLRLGPVSGHYEGEMTEPNPGSYVLDLRVDIDPRHANSPVMNRVSGDLYKVYKPPIGNKIFFMRVYSGSWIISKPTVKWSKCSVKITGSVWYFQRFQLIAEAEIIIPWIGGQTGPATVTIATVRGGSVTFSCKKISNAFREVTLEVDVCASVNTLPLLPSYDTHARSDRPVDLPQRTLTIEEAYQEAGINMAINPTHSIIDDSGNPVWTNAELHDAMETYFSQYPGSWPKWHVWALLAGGQHIQGAGVAGIMFDYGIEPPDRQGCAVFREHSWFDNLPSGIPANDDQAFSMRQFLYCYVHEIGHCFNLMHSWQKSYANPPQTNRPDAKSWMNYPQYVANFWNDFRFSFDEEELIHIRHAKRDAVIFGGQPFTEGAALSDIPKVIGESPVEFTVRSKGFFHFLEPVIVELKIKNVSEVPMELSTELSPESGEVMLYIQRPDGRTLPYKPVICILGDTAVRKIGPGGRHCQNVLVSFGKFGHYFDAPGPYRIQGFYQNSGSMLIPSGIHEIRIGRPLSAEEDRAAEMFYSRETGMTLYLGGSDSPFLKTGMETLRKMAEEFKDSPVGAHLSLTLAENLTRSFSVVKEGKRVVERKANPSEAVELVNRALKQQERDATTFTNITYHEAVRTKANMLATSGQKVEAKKELKELVGYLEARGVKKDVLDEIETYAKTL